jgi:hypothetical protein
MVYGDPVTAGPGETGAGDSGASGTGASGTGASGTGASGTGASGTSSDPGAGGPGGTAAASGSAVAASDEQQDRAATWRAVRVVRRVSSSATLQGLVALALYVAVMLATRLQPLLVHPSVPHLNDRGMDPDFFVWMLRWWPYAVAHLTDPLRTTWLRAPGASSLAWTSGIPALALAAAPLTETMGPLVSFNLLTVLAIPLAAWAAFVLCRRLTRRFWPSLAGGAVFGYSAYEIGHSPAGQIDITYTLLLPIIGYLVLLWWQAAIDGVTFVVLAGLAIAGQFYLFLETFADLTALLIVSLVLGLLLAGRTYRRKVARLAGLCAGAYAVALLLAAPYLYAALANVPNVLVVGRGLDLGQLEIYSPMFAVAVGLAVLRWFSRLTWFLLVMLVVIILVALGRHLTVLGHSYGSLPWGAIWRLRFLRDAFPDRLMVFVYLDLAVMTASFLAGPAARTWRQWARLLLEARWLVAGAIVAALVLDATSLRFIVPQKQPDPIPAFISSGQYRHVLSSGETVAVISDVGNAGMLWQSETNFYFRLAGGYLGAQFNTDADLPPQIQVLATSTRRTYAHLVSTFEAYVIRTRVGAILVQVQHKPWWAGIFRDMGLRGHLAGGVMVYRTHFHASLDSRARRPRVALSRPGRVIARGASTGRQPG